MAATSGPAKRAPAKATRTFSSDEAEAMEERATEIKASRRKGARPDGEADLLAKIAEMAEADRLMAERLHAIVKAKAPGLRAKTWYGMPAYANAADKIVCFFQPAARFKTRYATLGFNDAARLDEDGMWPTGFALTRLTDVEAARIAALLERAAG